MWKKMRGKQSGGAVWDLSREEASEVFQEYYKCVTKRFEEAWAQQIGKQKPVHAVMALEGERVTLKCTVCSRPDRDKLSQQAIWQHVRRSDSTLGPLVGGVGGKRVKQAAQGSLTIRELQLEDAGQYTCLDSTGNYVAIYQVDVKFRERQKMVKEGDHVLNTTVLEDHNLQLMTSWTSWGPCNTCDVPGTRQRHGTCVVKKLNITDPVKPKDFPMVLLYPDGVPCHSTALPPRIRLLRPVRRRYEETLVAVCNQSCPTEAPPVIITDKDGKEVEVLPSGRFYNLNEKPPIPTMVKRRVIFEPEGKHLVLQCSDVVRGSGVRWMRGKRRVDPLSIRRQTAGRVWVDSANRLHIALLLLSDTAVYNCWERQRHVVAIKVMVVDGFSEQMKNYITYAGFGITILATLIACCCIFVGGQKRRVQ
ncbi:Ig-like V-type domain-containing protein FAM187A [Babylonia areolata]|uniref:Ig-like V-type domain-containing protein FAM187A n=1 Tax=Babylonia areolata TaxID=304850 RepID=UPI003FD5AF08